MSGLTTAHGGNCQLCNGYSQLLTSYGDRDLCPICWQDQMQDREPVRLAALLDGARRKAQEIAHGQSG